MVMPPFANYCPRFKNHIHFADRGKHNHNMIVNHDGENLASSSSDYKMPLVWVDLEMTG